MRAFRAVLTSSAVTLTVLVVAIGLCLPATGLSETGFALAVSHSTLVPSPTAAPDDDDDGEAKSRHKSHDGEISRALAKHLDRDDVLRALKCGLSAAGRKIPDKDLRDAVKIVLASHNAALQRADLARMFVTLGIGLAPFGGCVNTFFFDVDTLDDCIDGEHIERDKGCVPDRDKGDDAAGDDSDDGNHSDSDSDHHNDSDSEDEDGSDGGGSCEDNPASPGDDFCSTGGGVG